ncbi:MAG: hypothetical protein MJ102_01545 [Clostridia bacterium]|nr:hypothetical protein [Clostridia bacterium]
MYEGIKLAVLGGDLRFAAMARMFADRGIECAVWGMGSSGNIGKATRCSDWRSAVGGSAAVILPLPVSGDGVRVNCPIYDEGTGLRLSTLFGAVKDSVPVIGGKISEEVRASAAEKNVRLIDYFASEELQIRNAVPTAEGAVMLAMQAMNITVRGAKVAVVGYGRIGKTLSSLLHSMGADVTVAARKSSDLAYAGNSGMETLRLTESGDHGLLPVCSGYDAVFNTVPVRLWDRKLLEKTDQATYLLDLASFPGGVDMQAASELGLRAEWGLSLPGRLFPESSGFIIGETVLEILKRERIV